MNDILADTHAAVWYISDQSKLSALALHALHDVESKGGLIFISVITLIEVRYLIDKGKLAQKPGTTCG